MKNDQPAPRAQGEPRSVENDPELRDFAVRLGVLRLDPQTGEYLWRKPAPRAEKTPIEKRQQIELQRSPRKTFARVRCEEGAAAALAYLRRDEERWRDKAIDNPKWDWQVSTREHRALVKLLAELEEVGVDELERGGGVPFREYPEFDPMAAPRRIFNEIRKREGHEAALDYMRRQSNPVAVLLLAEIEGSRSSARTGRGSQPRSRGAAGAESGGERPLDVTTGDPY